MGPKTLGELSRLGNVVVWDIRRLRECFPKSKDIFEGRSPDFKLSGGTWRFALKLEFEELKVTYTLKLHQLSCSRTEYRIRLAVRGGKIGQVESNWLNEEEAQLQIIPFDFQSVIDEKLTFTCTVCQVSAPEEAVSNGVEETSNGNGAPEGEVVRPGTSVSKSVDKLVKDFQDLLKSKEGCDVVLNVDGKEYECHRLILGTRSPVFSAMFQHDTSERQKGVVDIEDCDPNSFQDFLHYVYTGRVENLTSANVLSLYTAADKYLLSELKQECLDNMKNSVSANNFCDILSLSLRYEETDLTRIATEFFLRNAADVVVTSKWQTFLAENPTAGNELFVKLTTELPAFEEPVDREKERTK